MRELSDVMADAVAARARSMSGLTPTEPRLAAVKNLVRRHRASRRTLQAIVSVSVVAVALTGAWYGLDHRDGPPPAVTPTPTVSPSPSHTPSTTPDEIVLGDPINEPGLPTYYAMPDGLLEQVGSGWVVTVHRPDRYVGDDETGSLHEAVANMVFLVSPEGTRFEVADLHLDQYVSPLSWDAGETRVRVRTGTIRPGSWYGDHISDAAAWLDLETGEITLDPAGYTDGELTRDAYPGGPGVGDWDWLPRTYSPDDARSVVWQPYGGAFVLIDAAGRTTDVAYGVAGKACSIVGWMDSTALLTLCLDDGIAWGDPERDYHPAFYRLDLVGAAVVTTELGALSASEPLPNWAGGAWVRDGVVAFPSVEGSAYGCWTGVDMWVNGAFQAVQRPGDAGENLFDVEAVSGVLYVTAQPGCSGDSAPMSLTAHDTRTGVTVVLAPAPEDWTEGSGGWVTDGLIGWVVAQ